MKDIDIHLAKLGIPANARGNIFIGYSINIDFNQIKIEANSQHMKFIEMIARVISHEYIHYAIFETTNNKTSKKFDKIAKNLKDYWGW